MAMHPNQSEGVLSPRAIEGCALSHQRSTAIPLSHRDRRVCYGDPINDASKGELSPMNDARQPHRTVCNERRSLSLPPIIHGNPGNQRVSHAIPDAPRSPQRQSKGVSLSIPHSGDRRVCNRCTVIPSTAIKGCSDPISGDPVALRS